jgi:hypothetical protein
MGACIGPEVAIDRCAGDVDPATGVRKSAPMPLPEALTARPRLAALAAKVLADPEGWSFFQLKTELSKLLSPCEAHAAFGELLADIGPISAGTGPLRRLIDRASSQPAFHTYSAAERIALPGAPLSRGGRGPAFTADARALFVARLDDAITFGRSNLRALGVEMVSDLQGDEANRYQTCWWFDPIISACDGEEMLYHLPATGGAAELDEAIDLTGVFSPGWGHTVLEFAPQLLLADVVAKVPPEVPVLVDANLPEPSYELFRFLSPTRPQIQVGFRQAVRVRHLWAASSPEYWPALRAPGQTLHAEGTSLHPDGLAGLLRYVPHGGGLPDPSLRRVFLARGRDPRLGNQDDVIARFVREGFVTVHPERLGFLEQLRLVQNATHVAGAWGSQMMLALLMGRPELRVMLFCGPDLEEGPSLAITAERRGQQVVVLQGALTRAHPSLPYNSLYWVDGDDLDAALSEWL